MTSNQFNLKIFKASFFLAWMLVYSSFFSELTWAQVSGKPLQLIDFKKDDSSLADTGQSEPRNRYPGGTHARDWDFERDGQSSPDNLSGGGTYEHPPNFPDGQSHPEILPGARAGDWDFEGDGQSRSGERNSGGSRNGRIILPNPNRGSAAPVNHDSCTIDNRALTALVPKTNLGLTTDSHPTFWFYIPEEMANVDEAEFMLLDDENNPAIDEPIAIELSNTSGFVSVSLPATAKPLEVDREYRWFFALQYNPQSRSSNPSVEGWIQRVEPNSTLVRELEETADTEDYIIYANHGIWYDALTELVKQYRTQQGNPILEADWLALLEAACLEEISATPE